MMQLGKEAKILWVTNLPAPYRFPIWDRMSSTINLEVTFLLKEQNWRNWSAPARSKWKYSYLAYPSIQFREFDIIPSIRGVSKLLDGKDILVLGGWEAPSYLWLSIIAKFRKIPRIQFYESTLKSHRFNNIVIRKIRFLIFSQASFIVTAGTDSTRAVEAMGIASEKIVTLFNPVDVDWFYSATRNRKMINSTGHHFLYVGQLIERKRVDLLLRSFANAKNHEDTLTIAGEGLLDSELRELAQSLGITGSVIFTGQRSQKELADLYAQSNTLILPSSNEVWGLVVNEALASGLHVIVSENCGVAEFVKNMKGAYICSVTEQSLQENMQKSAKEWSGYIQNPEILKYTPERYADEFLLHLRNFESDRLRSKLIWLTNIPTPYRIPVWNQLDSRFDLHLVFLNSTEKGRHWILTDSLRNLNYRFLNVKAYFFHDQPFYLGILRTLKYIRNLRAQFIYIDGWESPAFYMTALLANRMGLKLIFGYRSTLKSHRFNNIVIRKIRFLIFSQASFIVTAGTDSTRAVEAMGIASEKIVTLFNPVDVDWFYSATRNRKMINSTGHHFLYVGQLIERKRVDLLLRSFANAKNHEDTLTIAGEGLLDSELRELAQSLGITGSVIFTGQRSQKELADLYAQSNTLILPSSNEVWGLVVNEALASGLHVIVSENCGVAEFVKNMKGAYICSVTEQSLQENMQKSAKEWSGYIQNPEILKYTPERYADEFLLHLRNFESDRLR